jgi:hypothetical protein
MSKMLAEELLKLEGDGRGAVRPVSSQEHARLRELLQGVDWFNAEERKVIADVVTTKMVEEIRKEDITPFFADIDTFNVGDTPEYTFNKGLKAHVHEPGTYAPRSTFTQRTITIGTELVTVHPEMELSQLQAGRYGTMATMKNMAREELLGHKNSILWTTLINSIPSTAPEGNYRSYASTASNAIKKDLLVSGIDYVDDTAPGGIKAIVGRRSVLGFLNELGSENTGTYYSEQMKQRIEGTGGSLIGDFRGIPLVALHQYTDGYDVNRINADNIMLVANDTTKLAVTEPISTLEDINIDDRMWHWRVSEKYGAAVFWPERNFRFEIT